MSQKTERTYKHQVPADIFVEAFTTHTWSAGLKEKFNHFGIERLSGLEVKSKLNGIVIPSIRDDFNYTYIENAKINPPSDTNWHSIKHSGGLLPSLFLFESKIGNCSIFNSHLYSGHAPEIITSLYFIKSETASFYFHKTTIGELRIEHSKTGSFTIKESSIGDVLLDHAIVEDFVIDSCTNGMLRIWDESVIGDIGILNNSNIDDISVLKSKTGNFNVGNDCKVGVVKIKEFSIVGYLNIEKSIAQHFEIIKSLTGNFKINNSTIGDITMQGNSTTGDLNIQNDSKTGIIKIIGGHIGDLNISDSESSQLNVEKIYTSLNFYGVILRQCNVKTCNISTLHIENGCKIELYVSNKTIINKIDFTRLTVGKESILSFSDVNLYSCIMDNFTSLGNLFFRNIKKAETIFEWYSTEDELKKKSISNDNFLFADEWNDFNKNILERYYSNYLENTTTIRSEIPKPTLRIAQSSLGKTEFTECELGGFKFEYGNSKLTEIFINGGTLPNEVSVHGITDKKGLLEQQKSFFNQLKKVFENQGDVVRATQYHARASEIQLQILELENGRNSEWWVYYLNKISNRHGESWWQAVKFIVIASIPAYFIYLLLNGLLSFNSNATWDWSLIGYYFSFLDPTHKIDFMEKVGGDTNFWTMTIDFAGRIIIGYGIYQLISAFRKHGKKM